LKHENSQFLQYKHKKQVRNKKFLKINLFSTAKISQQHPNQIFFKNTPSSEKLPQFQSDR
jgi:hypothetical protein